jgi:hypothetical protein
MMGRKDRQTPPREEEDMKWGNMMSIFKICLERCWILAVGNSVKNSVGLRNQLNNQVQLNC